MKFKASASDVNIQRLGKERCDEVIGEVVRGIVLSGDRLGAWKEKLVKYYDLYAMVHKKKNYDGLAQIFVPEILRAVETITANIYTMLVSSEDWFQYVGRDTLPGEDGPALALTRLTMYEMDENGFKARLMDAIRQMVITGLCVRKILWDFKIVDRKRRGPDGLPIKYQDTIRDTWTFEPVDLFSFHISDVNIPYNDIQKAKWIAEQYIVDKQYVYDKMKKGWFSSVNKEDIEKEEEASASPAKDFSDRKLSSAGFTIMPKQSGKIELIEQWGLCRADWVLSEEELIADGLDADDLVESVIVIANRNCLLKLEVNPFWHGQKPYVSCPYIPKENEFAGIGAAQVGETLQEEINDTRNQTMDNKTLILMTMWLKTRASGIKNQDLRIRPNGVVATNDINGLVPLRPPVVAGVGTNMESIAKNDLRESVGAASNLQGIAQTGVGTATEAAQINAGSLGRTRLNAELFAQTILRPTLQFAEYLNYQFYDHSKVINVIGPAGVKFIKISPEEIGGYKNVIIKLSTDMSENPAVIRQQLMNFLTVVQGLPPQVLQFHWKLLDKIYGSFFDGRKLSELYPTLEQDKEAFLSPEEERDCILAGKGVLAKPGQDHKLYLDYLTKEFEEMKWSLSHVQFGMFEKLIASHHDLMIEEIEARQQQFLIQQAMMQQSGKGGVNTGQIPNVSASTMTDAPSGASIARSIGG